MTKFIQKIISKYQCEFKIGQRQTTSNGKKIDEILLLYAALLTSKQLHFNS